MKRRVTDVAVRAWPVPDLTAHTSPPPQSDTFGLNHPPWERSPPRPVKLGPSDWSLIFDTETMPDLGQALRILTWQVRLKGTLIEEGIGYDPDQLTDAELECVRRYGADTGCPLLEVTEFIEHVFFRSCGSSAA
jgi:hypothetical protein